MVPKGGVAGISTDLNTNHKTINKIILTKKGEKLGGVEVVTTGEGRNRKRFSMQRDLLAKCTLKHKNRPFFGLQKRK